VKVFDAPDMYGVTDVFVDQLSNAFPPLVVEPDVQSEEVEIVAASPQ